jgi:glycosyltransferase involved in cell wall biosynthesis
MMAQVVELSAIVPVCDLKEEEGELAREYLDVLRTLGKSFELVFVLDGEHQKLRAHLEHLAASEPEVRIIQLTRSFGEATALTAGLEHTTGDIVLTLPAYDQVESGEIPRLVESLDKFDVAVGRRRSKDAEGRSGGLRRKVFHGLVAFVTGHRFRDLGCGMRALRRSVTDEIPLYGDLYRFIALLAARRGFRVVELDVAESSTSHHGGYSARVYLARLLDILSIVFLVRFTKKPLRFFGMVGGVTFAVGSLLVFYVVVQRLFFNVALADRPALLLSSLLVVLGLQLFALGLLGELIIFTHARDMKEYTIDKIVN